jgi:hypothetical protein
MGGYGRDGPSRPGGVEFQHHAMGCIGQTTLIWPVQGHNIRNCVRLWRHMQNIVRFRATAFRVEKGRERETQGTAVGTDLNASRQTKLSIVILCSLVKTAFSFHFIVRQLTLCVRDKICASIQSTFIPVLMLCTKLCSSCQYKAYRSLV